MSRPSWRLLFLTPLVAACSIRSDLHDAILGYDESVSRTQAELLLLNIARAHHGRPLHFTTVGGFAATFKTSASAGVGADLGSGSSSWLPAIHGSLEENPTMSLLPVQGEEYARRILRPISESEFELLYHQGAAPAVLIGLSAASLIVERDGARREHANGAGDGFAELLARIVREHDDRRLDVGPIEFTQSFPLPTRSSASIPDLADSIERGFTLSADASTLQRRVIGRLLIANYDPMTLDEAQRAEIQHEAQRFPVNFVLVDLRSGGGAPAVRGWMKLRSIGAMIRSAAGGIGRGVDDPALVVREGSRAPADALVAVKYAGREYWIPSAAGSPESVESFGLLYQLMQMSVTESGRSRLPPVTIAK